MTRFDLAGKEPEASRKSGADGENCLLCVFAVSCFPSPAWVQGLSFAEAHSSPCPSAISPGDGRSRYRSLPAIGGSVPSTLQQSQRGKGSALHPRLGCDRQVARRSDAAGAGPPNERFVLFLLDCFVLRILDHSGG